ncbi:sensor histidine kinase [Gordonia sp. (in: high G+C Gram-positive bacteria)]|uniref:sensor histidine kinase n=1 Tax=Gordonia sp. (in: high G+C Gram-positive bacteria) TaxID=84139 RepID=UPI0035277479
MTGDGGGPATPAAGDESGRAVSAAGREHVVIFSAMARFLGGGFVAYLLISIPDFGHPKGMVEPWFTPVAVVLAFGPGVLLLAVTFLRAGDRWIGPLVALSAAGFLMAGGLWFAAWTGHRVSAGDVTWLMTFAGLPALAVSMFRLRLGIVVLAATSTLAAAIDAAGRSDGSLHGLVCDALWSMVFTLPFMIAVRLLVRTGRVLGETRADAIEAAAASASAAAQDAERARFDALIHDRVIATLVATRRHAADDRLPEQARAALDELTRLARGPDPHAADVSIAETLARLRTFAAAIDPEVPVGNAGHDGLDPAVPRYPESAVQAMVEAMGEALRNVVLHAGPHAQRAVLVEPGASSLTVTVGDDGRGFDVGRVPPERLGMAVSIRGRMAELPGGRADVRSRPGEGTTVVLRWNGDR